MSNKNLSEFDIQEAIKDVANLMGVAARTAPKSAGNDFVVVKAIYGEDVTRLAKEMVRYGEEMGKKNFDRDGANVKNSLAVLLIGIKDAASLGLNCGACGYDQCADRNSLLEANLMDLNVLLEFWIWELLLGQRLKLPG